MEKQNLIVHESPVGTLTISLSGPAGSGKTLLTNLLRAALAYGDNADELIAAADHWADVACEFNITVLEYQVN